MTDAHKSLAEALAAFQGETPSFKKTKTAKVRGKTRDGTPFEYEYHYADLGDILPIVGPLLAKHGLSWSSKPLVTDAGFVLAYVLRHTSGDEDAGEIPLGVPQGCKPQELGSAITYMRRYALTAQLNVATEEDDDAQAAQEAERPANAQPSARFTPQSERAASAAQRRLINARAGERRLSVEALATVVATVVGDEARKFESAEQAKQWLNHRLDRLPARLVDPVLDAITKAPLPE